MQTFIMLVLCQAQFHVAYHSDKKIILAENCFVTSDLLIHLRRPFLTSSKFKLFYLCEIWISVQADVFFANFV